MSHLNTSKTLMADKDSLRIVIDGRMVSNTGIGRWLENIVSSLVRIAAHHRITVMVNSDSQRTRSFPIPTRKIRIRAPIYSLREQVALPLELGADRPDVVHYPNFNVPIFDSTNCVVTLSDIIYYLFPEACPSWHAHQYARFMIRQAGHKARRVVTVSEYSKRDLVNHLGIPEDKIEVIYPAVDPQTFHANYPDSEVRGVVARYKIRKPYIFYTGNHEPRKNLLRLIRAYKMLRIRNDFHLVIGGRIDARRHDVYTEISELWRTGDVILCDEIREADLPKMYAGAALFVFPSLYEGFGFPPLEAMAAGSPVACSCSTSLPEVVGHAAKMFVPTEEDDIAQAIQDVLTSPDLASALRRKGLVQAQRFSWSKAAAQLIRIYEAVASK